MSTIETASTSNAGAPFRSSLASRIVKAVRAVLLDRASAIRARRTARQLNELTDWELKDIGLTRSDIERVARSHLRAWEPLRIVRL